MHSHERLLVNYRNLGQSPTWSRPTPQLRPGSN